MAIKFRYVDILTGTSHVGAGAVSGEARGNIGLGAEYGRVLGVEIKGDDANVNATAQFALTDAKGRQLLAAKAIDAGDTTFDEYTSQEDVIGTAVSVASTVGALFILGYPEDQYLDSEGDFSANTEGMVAGLFAKSPVTVAQTAGTDGDWFRVGLWVEV